MIKNNISFFSKLILLLGDIFAIVVSFAFAYFFRVYIDDKPYYFEPGLADFVQLVVLLIPLWILVLVVSGMYQKETYLFRAKEYAKIFVVSVISVMSLISYGFLVGEEIFPVRVIAVYYIGISFVLMILIRELAKLIIRTLYRIGVGRKKVIIVGDNSTAAGVAGYFKENKDHGYDVVGVVSKEANKKVHKKHFSNLKLAIEKTKPDVILQTDNVQTESVYNQAVENHLTYLFIPSQERFLSRFSSVEIIDAYPVVDVKITRLNEQGRIIKRLFDIIAGGILLILALPFILVIAIIVKLDDPKGGVFYRQSRLTRHNKEFKIFKFRTMRAAYSGMSPEEGFAKMGKPHLAKQYRDNGDQLDYDPRVTRVGHKLRAWSLDEIPQLINVVKGDISLVGPRALVPSELNQYERKSLILSVKSGLTGLAQVSGRRDISFEERRRLDVYYVQNWSFLMDIQILFKTAYIVLLRIGAK